MTLIIGIQCSDGVVIGSDGVATLGALGNTTVSQPVKKLSIISGSVILGVSGPIGLGQRFHGELHALWEAKKFTSKKPYEAMTMIRQEFWKHAEMELKAAQVTAPIFGQNALNDAISHSMVAMPVGKEPCLFQFSPPQCSPEISQRRPSIRRGGEWSEISRSVSCFPATNLLEERSTFDCRWNFRYDLVFRPSHQN